MALISLLVDEDPAIYRVVRRKLLSYGQLAKQWVRPFALSNDPVMRRRVLEIVQHLDRQTYDSKLLSFCLGQSEELDLEKATGLLSQTRYPDANPDAYAALYDNWAADLQGRIAPVHPPDKILTTLNHYYFDELQFSGNQDYVYDPTSCYLNRVVDNRSGSPINLCALYLFIARRLHLPVTGVGLPNYFLCRFQSSTQEIYIDVFRHGVLLTKADCVRMILRTRQSLEGASLSPMTNRRIFLRMCANLHRTYAHLELTDEAARIQRYLVALTR